MNFHPFRQNFQDDIFADLERVVNGGRRRKPRDDTPSMMSDETSPSRSTPNVPSPPVSPGQDPSPPSHIEPQGYPRGYYGHRRHDSAENALISSTQHLRIEPSKSVSQARVPSHYPMLVESSFAQTKSLSPRASRTECYPPIVETTKSTTQARLPCPYPIHTEPPRAIRVIEPSRDIAPIPPSNLATERQVRVTEIPRYMAPRPIPQPANKVEHPKTVARPLVRLRTLAPRIITTNGTETRTTETQTTETRTRETRTIEPKNTPKYPLRVDKAKELSEVDTSRLNLLADSALGNSHKDDQEIDELHEGNEVTYIPAVKRQKAQKLEKPPRPPPQKKRGRYECKLCPQVCTRNFDLTRHVRTVHETRPKGDILSRTCPVCGEVQSRGDSHKRHMALVPASCERQARILGKPAPPEHSDKFYAMCRARACPPTPTA